MRKNKIHNQGFIALSTVLVLSAIFLSIGIGMTTIASFNAQNNLSVYFGNKAHILAEACTEYALYNLRESSDYQGNENLQIDGETCEILVIGGSGNTDRTIQVQSTVSDFTKRIEVVVEAVLPETKITSFKSVVNF